MNHHITNANIKEWARDYDGPLFDGILCDPPYELGFMGKSWDSSGIAFDTEMWADLFRHIKPGGHLLAFSGSRTYHRMAVAIEDAGFEIRDMIEWVYGSGFPKSLNIGKAVDKITPRLGMFDKFAEHFKQQRLASGKSQKEIATLFPSKTGGITGCVWNWENGANVPTTKQWAILQPLLDLSDEFADLIERVERERELVGTKTTNKTVYQRIGQDNESGEVEVTKGNSPYEGYGTALKPAHEPCVLARKPLEKGMTVANNVLKHGTGGLNIDGTRVGTEDIKTSGGRSKNISGDTRTTKGAGMYAEHEPLNTVHQGRFPANLIHDGSDEVEAVFPTTNRVDKRTSCKSSTGMFFEDSKELSRPQDNGGSASRFFFSAKPDLYCSLCYGIMEVCENNAQNAQTTSQLGTQASNTAQDNVVVKQAQEPKDKQLSKTNNAHNAVSGSASTNQTTVNTVQPNAMQNLNELLDLAAKYAESQCLQCQTSIAQKLVVMATESMESQVCQDFTQDYKNSIQTESLVLTVAYLANIDITQTTINLTKLCGFAHLATDGNTRQANQENNNATSRLKYTAKASKSERNAGLEGFEDVKFGRSGGSQNAIKNGQAEYITETESGYDRIMTVKNHHPTVKPISLTKYLATLIKPPTGGRLLVPFSGSGSEMIGALQAGWEYVEGVELTEEYIPIAEARIKYWLEQKAEEDNKPKQESLL